jgi:hypothetical protein
MLKYLRDKRGADRAGAAGYLSPAGQARREG